MFQCNGHCLEDGADAGAFVENQIHIQTKIQFQLNTLSEGWVQSDCLH